MATSPKVSWSSIRLQKTLDHLVCCLKPLCGLCAAVRKLLGNAWRERCVPVTAWSLLRPTCLHHRRNRAELVTAYDHFVYCEQSLVSQRGLLLSDAFALLSLLGVQLDVALPLFRHIVLVVDRFDWTLRDACLAVNALFGWMYNIFSPS